MKKPQQEKSGDVQNNGKTTRGGCTGRGFVPGRSGNPGGRPKGLAQMVKNRTGDGEKLIEKMYEFAFGRRRVPALIRFKALEWLADRGWGKARQDLSVSDEEREPLWQEIIERARAIFAERSKNQRL